DVAIGDFDGDGLRDLAVADSSGAYRVRILRNTGGGIFVTQEQDTSTFASCSAIVVGDLDRDGHQDLAVATRQSGFGGLDTWLGNGHGGFRFEGHFATGGDSPVSLAIENLYIPPPDIAIPYLDVAVADDAGCSGTGLVGALFGDGSGGFPGGPPDTYTMGGCPRQVAVADLNLDGNLDLLTADENSSTISVRLGSSINTGTFPTYATASVPGGPISLAVGDLNGDGKPDLAVGVVGSGQVFVLIGAGDGTFGAATPYGDVGYSTPNRVQRVRIADVDGDGKQDVLALDQGPGALWLFRGNGDGTLSDFPMGYGMDKVPTSFALGDLDGDGRLDAAATVRDLDEVEILLNRGGPGVTDAAPVVSGPAQSGGEEGGTITFSVAAQDPDGGGAPSLSADLSALPAGNAASFVTTPPSPCITGIFTWPLKTGEAGVWPVTFTASNSALGSYTTLVHVEPAGTSARGSFVWTPGPADVGSYVLTFKAYSADGDSSETSTTITVSSGGAAAVPARSVRVARAPAMAMKGPIISALNTADAYVGQTLVVDVTASNTDSLIASGDALPADNSGTFTSDVQPYVAAPASGAVEPGEQITILVSAADPNGDPIDSLTADLSSFPQSGDAAFTAGPGNTSGTFTWTPAAGDSGDYGVTFYAKNQLVGNAGTVIHVRRGLLGYWELNGDGSDAARGNHLTPTGAISYTAGRLGLAANRDASHDTYLSCPATHDFDLTPSGFTFECWAKIRSYSPLGGGIIAAADSGSTVETWALAVNETGVPFFAVVDQGSFVAQVGAAGAVPDTLYHHYAATYDGTNLILYIDGVLSGSVSAPGISAVVGGGEFRLGSFAFTDQAYLEGQTDEVRLWGRARSQSEIQASMNSELSDFPTGVFENAPPPVNTLLQNAPNPFNPATTIRFSLARAGHLRLRVFDPAGRLVATLIDGQRPAGAQRALWDGRDARGHRVASGVYFYQLTAPGFVRTRSMVLLK
ncbi:MAG: FG-GAP-like repeat-containing protein, partial [Gemmatimonadota bacterium]